MVLELLGSIGFLFLFIIFGFISAIILYITRDKEDK